MSIPLVIFLGYNVILQVCLLASGSSPAYDRVHGILVTSIIEYPHQVSIFFRNTQRYCSGIILNEATILTSALCATSTQNAADITVRAGTLSQTDDGQIFAVDRIIVYPSFKDKLGSDFNIAVLFLNKPIEFSMNIQPVRLPEECEKLPIASDSITMVGWRKLKGGAEFSKTLKKLRYPFVNKTACIEKYGKSAADTGLLTSRTFCAGFLEDGRAGCSISGSAALINDVLYGIYVWGKGCGSVSYPDVFANIAAYRGWIRAITRI